MSLREKINIENLPNHIAIIMDGNGRWAKQQDQQRVFGHQNGVKAVREVTEGCAELGVSYVTLYAFSTENWDRPTTEINALMELLVATIKSETHTLMKNNIRLNAIGDLTSLPQKCYNELQEAIAITKNNDRTTLSLALSYSSRWEITQAVKTLMQEAKQGKISPEELTDEVFSDYLCTYNIPDPELLIRTGGEYRISNYLLWQIAYTELYFPEVLWPDFNKEELYKAIIDYQARERRFGKISEQLQ